MSSISSIGGGYGAWSAASSTRSSVQGARPPGGADPARMFSKTDSDGSGGVDASELQSMFSDMAARFGSQGTSGTTPDAQQMLTQFDADGDGSLSQDELGQGMQSLSPPTSTMDFAQKSQSAQGAQQGQGGPGGAGGPPPGGPPPAGAASSSTSDSTTLDPLDTNEDGTVSAEEAAAGKATEDLMKALLEAVDTDDDGQLSKAEMDTFQQVMTDQLQAMTTSSPSTSSTPSSATAERPASLQASVTQLANLVIKQYAAMADSASQQTSGSALSLAA